MLAASVHQAPFASDSPLKDLSSSEENNTEETFDLEMSFLTLFSHFNHAEKDPITSQTILDAENDNNDAHLASQQDNQNTFDHQNVVNERAPVSLEAPLESSYENVRHTHAFLPKARESGDFSPSLPDQNQPEVNDTQRTVVSLHLASTQKSHNDKTPQEVFTLTHTEDHSPDKGSFQDFSKIHTDESITFSQSHFDASSLQNSVSEPKTFASSISPSLMLNQVVTHVKEHLQTSSTTQTFTLTLIPKELGEVTIRVSFEGNVLSLSFHGLSETVGLLKQHQGLLIQNLSNQGVCVNATNISFKHDTQEKRGFVRPDAPPVEKQNSLAKIRASLSRLRKGVFA